MPEVPVVSAPTPRRRMRHPLSPIEVLILVMAALTLAACGGAAAVPMSDDAQPASLERSDLTKGSHAELDALVDDAALAAGAPSVEEPLADGQRVIEIAADGTASVADDALIVRTGFLELEVADIAAVLLSARADIAALGGYVAGSDVYDQGEQRWASVVYRVPVERFEEAIDALRGLADRVVRESTQSQEVTAQVVDLDARIENLRASEDALVTIMDRAGRIEDVLAVQMRLEDVRRQIEQLTAQRDELAGRAALATLTASWMTPVAAVAIAQEGWDVATEIDAALAQTVAALQGLASLLVWGAVVGVPLLGIPLLVAILALVAIRRRTAGRGDGGSSGAAAVAGPAVE
jgi:Domain of unknown function (DUF4349)